MTKHASRGLTLCPFGGHLMTKPTSNGTLYTLREQTRRPNYGSIANYFTSIPVGGHVQSLTVIGDDNNPNETEAIQCSTVVICFDQSKPTNGRRCGMPTHCQANGLCVDY